MEGKMSMQTPKKSVSKNSSSEVLKKASPITPKSSRKINVTVSESDSTSSACPGTKTPKNRSPKLVERKSPRTPVTEKKRPSKLTELEAQVTQLQEDLKKARDQLTSSESWKKQAEEEAEEAKKQSMISITKLEEVQKQIKDLSESEDARVQELRKISQERDLAWQSELEAVQKQHSADSSALFSALNELQSLRQQVEMLSSSEANQVRQAEVAGGELQTVKDEMTKTLSLVSSLKNQLEVSEKTEEEYQILVNQTQVQLDIAKNVIETLKSDGLKIMETLDSTVMELKEYKARVVTLEEAVRKSKSTDDVHDPIPECEEIASKSKLDSLNCEVELLNAALEEAEVKWNEEQIKYIMQIESANEEAENAKARFSNTESALRAAVDEAREEITKLKECIVNREMLLSDLKGRLDSEKRGGGDHETDPGLEGKVQKSVEDILELRVLLEDKETKLRSVVDENRRLKLEIERKEDETSRSRDSAKAEIDRARAAEQEAVEKMGAVAEEADKSSRSAARATEQLEATQAANSEMESELRRLRIQSDQWRKAAEAAAAILTSGNNGNMMERTGSFGPNSNSLGGKLLNSPFSEDDESPKKKNNMLKKIGVVLWKKGQK